jgi:DNA-binding NarL/FixJ family response regulator
VVRAAVIPAKACHGASTLTPMPLRVAVIDPLPLYRQGVVAVLAEAGYVVDTPVDLLLYLRSAGRAVILLTMRTASMELQVRLQEVSRDHHLIAVVEEGLFDEGVEALRAGARAVLWRTASPDALRRAVEASAEGETVLPAGLVPVLIGRSRSGAVGSDVLTDDELTWLRQLAGGSTVARLAVRSGYSDRAMFRLLHHLYAKMGVKTRTQAILRAQEFGWLGEGDLQE